MQGFEPKRRERTERRRKHIVDLQAVAAEIAEPLRLLDGLVRYRVGDDAELMTAWASARNVVGPFRSRGEADAETPGL